MLDVTNDTDNLPPSLIKPVQTQPLANHAAERHVGEMTPRQFVINNHDKRRGFVVLRFKVSARQKRNAERAMILFADRMSDRDRSLAGLWLRLAFYRVFVIA